MLQEVGEPSKEEKAVAKYLRFNCPTKSTNMMGHRVDYFIGRITSLKSHYYTNAMKFPKLGYVNLWKSLHVWLLKLGDGHVDVDNLRFSFMIEKKKDKVLYN